MGLVDVVGIDGIGVIDGFGNIGGVGGVGGLKPTLQPTIQLPPSFPRRRESRPFGTETYRINGFSRFRILDSHFRGNDGMQVRRNDAVQVSVRMDSSFPRRRESRPVGAETYRVKRFLEILRSRFPLSWE
ncbi:hypothetical protein NEILACOT_05160 [Neisseria lactamica ATCC 23970]|uniref:Uncharacterized protein n=1 Tax=Neisseria lactamica ATCC 23970 TaxID=546265 RepID=D0WC80_NEILA|nr:hypothetical protein NEILACOT_05160 [Neisseria lactamica ATCC 23970]